MTTVENYARLSNGDTAPRGLIGGAPVVDEAQRKYSREPSFPVPLLIAPATIWLVVFLFLPLVSIFIFSFWKSTGHGMTPGFTLEHYQAFFVTEGFFDPKSSDFLTPSIFIRTLVDHVPLHHLGDGDLPDPRLSDGLFPVDAG